MNQEKRSSGRSMAENAAFTVGGLTAVFWNTAGFLMLGAHPVVAVVLGAAGLLLMPSVVGFAIFAIVLGKIFAIPPGALAFRGLFSLLFGAIGGFVIGYPVGYIIDRLKKR